MSLTMPFSKQVKEKIKNTESIGWVKEVSEITSEYLHNHRAPFWGKSGYSTWSAGSLKSVLWLADSSLGSQRCHCPCYQQKPKRRKQTLTVYLRRQDSGNMKCFQAVGGKPLLTGVLERRYFNRVKVRMSIRMKTIHRLVQFIKKLMCK